MKGDNELHLSREAMREFVERHWNDKIGIVENEKITVDWVEWNSKKQKFVVLFHQKGTAKKAEG